MTNNDIIENKTFYISILDSKAIKPFDECNNASNAVFETDKGPEEPELSEYVGSCAKRISIYFLINYYKFVRAYNKAKRYGCPLYVYPRGCC